MEEFFKKWQNLITLLLVITIAFYGAYSFIYKPKIKEINSLVTSLKLIDSEIRMIPGGDLLLKDLESAKTLLKKELDAISEKIPSETKSPYLINNFISVVGKGLRIDYNLIQPLETVQEQKYKRLPLKIEFDGDYANLNTYLSQLKTLPVTIRVDALELKKLSGTKKLSVRMNLSAFVMPGGADNPSTAAISAPALYDPFYKELPSKGDITLQSVRGLRYSGYWIGKQITAIINDETLKVGDSIKGFTVLKIYKDRVILKKGTKLYDLTMEKIK